MSKTKSFRGILADEGQDKISLKTNDGKTGYKITKFQVMPNKPGVAIQDSCVKIYKSQQTTVDSIVNLSDHNLLGVAICSSDSQLRYYEMADIIIFDTEIFNQNIFVTHHDINTGEACNYYIELEQFKLNENESTMATLSITWNWIIS
jgi:hypothetical protein